MLEDGRRVPRGSVLDADLCIIGAGAAGITIARALAGSSLSVVLLESGGLQPDAKTQALYKGEQTGEPFLGGSGKLGLDVVRLRYLGGTTNHWAGWCRPLEPIDFGPTSARPDDAWPIDRSTLDPWYEQAVSVVQIGPFEFEHPYWATQGAGAPFLESDAVLTRMIQISFPLSFGDVYRDDLKRAQNVRTILHANVLRMNTDESGATVTDVDVTTLSQNEWKVRARAFVLATGGIEVPRLLLASNGRRAAGIGNEHDLVGRYFMEHMDVHAGFAVLSAPEDSLSLYKGFTLPVPEGRIAGRSYGVKGAHILSEDTLQQERLLGVEVTIAATTVGDHSEPKQRHGVDDLDVVALSKQLDGAPWPTVAYVRALGEQSPNPESRVTLARNKDPLGMPRVDLDWRLTGDDRESIRRSVQLIADELGRAGAGRLQVGVGGVSFVGGADPAQFEAYRVVPADFDSLDYPVGVGFHHMGTARMHSDPTKGVVDEQCRVHSTTNLFIGGSAVFPTSGTSTPTFTIVALALRMADHLRQEVLT
jgi:choline dehydrogenase-like flavoprotein